MTIFQFTLLRSLRHKSTLAVMYAAPLALIFISPLWAEPEATGFALYGMVLMLGAFSMVRLTMEDRVTGTVVRIFVAPVTTAQYLSQTLLAFCLLISLQTVVMVAIGAALYGWGIEMTARLILCYIIFSVTAIAFSLAWSSMFRSKVLSDAVFSILASFMAILGGIFIPLSLLPDMLRKIGMLFPTYWLSNALLWVQNQGSNREYWLSILILLLFSAAFLLYGSKRRLE